MKFYIQTPAIAGEFDCPARPFRPSIVDDRVAKMESDLEHVQEDFAVLKTDVREIRHEVKDLRTEFSGFRVEVKREFGALQTELRTSVQQNEIWMLLIAFGTVLVPTVTALAHALKWF